MFLCMFKPETHINIHVKVEELLKKMCIFSDNGIIAEYHFHGSMVKPGKFTLFMPGLWNNVVTESRLGWFTYMATNTRLEVGDTVYFWLMVVLTNGNRCIRDRLEFTVLYANGKKYPSMFWNGTWRI